MVKYATQLNFALGSFEGFNFRSQSALCEVLDANGLLAWDHDLNGEAEFWPAGDHPGVSLVFSSQCAVSATEILALDKLLHSLGSDDEENFLKIHFAMAVLGSSLDALSSEQIEDMGLMVFQGANLPMSGRKPRTIFSRRSIPNSTRHGKKASAMG